MSETNRFNFNFEPSNDLTPYVGGAGSESNFQPLRLREGELKGHFLVASPSLTNTPFERTVVLVLQSDTTGTFGVVLNRPANQEIISEWQEITGTMVANRNVVHGGPVGGPVFAIHQQPALGDMEMAHGIFLSANHDSFRQLAKLRDDRYRIVFGIAAWHPGQLSQEMQSGLWYPLQADADDVFEDPSFLWENSYLRYGDHLLCDVVGLKGLPDDPSWN